MSELSSTQQPRTRTMASDISKLFRSVSSAPLRTEKDTETPTSMQSSSRDKAGSTKKKITRIPLFGRTRRKSNQSSSSNPYASTSIIRGSTDVGEMSGRPPSPDPGSRPSLPSLSAPVPSPSKLSTSSFTKFAAHFSGSQSKSDLPLDFRASSSRTSLVSSPSSSGLVPPHTRPSHESGSSNRSTTPRGARPVIMVSTTDDMDEFKDLFTKELPTSKPASKPSPSSQESDSTQDSNGSVSRLPEAPMYRRGQTPASVLAAAVRDQQVHQRQPSASSKNSRYTTDSEKSSSNEKDGRSTPRLSTARESPRLVQGPESETHLPQPLSRHPSSSQGLEGSVRSRMRAPSTGSRTKPPSIPLPEIPTGSSDSHSKPDLPEPDSRASEAARSVRRPRSNTTSSIPEHLRLSSATLPQDRLGSTTLDPLINIEDINIDVAPPEHLRRALRSRNKQFEELTAYMLGREEAWSADRKALEKKIAVLQRDLVRRESEITGLKLIINDEDVLRRPKQLPSAILTHSRQSLASTSSPVQSDQEGSTQSHKSGPRRLNYQSDSGAESPKGSGNESSSSVLRLKRMHQRSSAIVGESYASRTGSTIRLPKFAQNLQERSSSESPYSKRVSMLSIASSASSSGSSSLMPPSPSVTMSSLSAIPEGAPPTTQQESNDRGLRASRRISASSITSSSTAASSVYSANIKRSRPPSIAQVLEKSPNIDDVLEKLRPFA